MLCPRAFRLQTYLQLCDVGPSLRSNRQLTSFCSRCRAEEFTLCGLVERDDSIVLIRIQLLCTGEAQTHEYQSCDITAHIWVLSKAVSEVNILHFVWISSLGSCIMHIESSWDTYTCQSMSRPAGCYPECYRVHVQDATYRKTLREVLALRPTI